RTGRLPRVILAPEQSQMRREKLIIELAAFKDTEALTVWAARILPQKNQLVTSDAVRLEDAFAAKLSQLERDRATEDRNAGIGKDAEPANGESSGSAPAAAAPQHTRSPELNGHRSPSRAPTGKNGSAKGVRLENVAEQSVTPIGKTLRMRDRDHLKF